MSRPEDIGQKVVGSNPVFNQVKVFMYNNQIDEFVPHKSDICYCKFFYRKIALKGKISLKYKIFNHNLKLFEQTINEFSSFLLLLPDK